jgi:hypothetical protein
MNTAPSDFAVGLRLDAVNSEYLALAERIAAAAPLIKRWFCRTVRQLWERIAPGGGWTPSAFSS